MNFYLIGIDYKTAPAETRELAFKKRREIELFCRDILCGQAVALFTCNRVEIYGVAPTITQSIDTFNKVQSVFGDIFSRAYFKKNTHETIHHAFRLACGLESQILFESQIVDQLRSWIKKPEVPLSLKTKWSFILNLSESVRHFAGIEELSKDIADFVLEDIQKRIGDLAGKKILIIGTGKIAELISQKSLKGAFLYFAARKKHTRALKLSQRAVGELIFFDKLPSMFYEVDVVVSATSSPHYVIKAGPVFQFVKNRAKPLYIYDLAVPMDVHPEVPMMYKVNVINMSDMLFSLESYRQNLKPSINKVESLIARIAWLNTRGKYEQTDQGRNKAELVSV